ncbi:MAG: hypothetical protein CME63_09115 [Halobacteriovoraceae bacterium]|nr:hypothetical protein [Halobacteriovoraceae bacterium]|tara:strand:+ start:90094 stop:90999 length:906 start_codon:yes stop_codon:yes gene_type:complete
MTHLKHKTRERLNHYLSSTKLNESCYFSENQVVGFHWANDKISSDYFKNLYSSSDQKFKERVEHLRGELENLKNFNIWLMSKRGQLKTNIYNLYESYLDPRLKHQWFDLEDILVSTQHEAGPFCSVKSMRWFDKGIYSKFVYLKMLENWVPQRQFRLSFNIPIEMRADGSPFGAIQAQICQMNSNGILINFSNGNPIKEWSNREVFFIKKPFGIVEEGGINEVFKAQEWLSALENFTMSGDTLSQKVGDSLKKQGENNHFVYIGFDEMTMLSLKSHDNSIAQLKDLFSEVKDSIQSHVKAA